MVRVMKKCPRCGVEKPITEYNKCKGRRGGRQTYCRGCAKDYLVRWHAAHTESRKRYARISHLRLQYRLTPEEFEALAARAKGRCELCFKPFKDNRDRHIDHDHETGAVRGLLCRKCNLGLGHFASAHALRSAAEYVDYHSQHPMERITHDVTPFPPTV